MAATTPIDALGELYTGITPALPPLYIGELPIVQNRYELPYALLLQTDEAPFLQKNPGTNGGSGIRHEVIRARFQIWFFKSADARAANRQLLAALTPKAVVVAGATGTVIEVTAAQVAEERHGAVRRLGAQPRPLGKVTHVQRVYVAWTEVKLRADYT